MEFKLFKIYYKEHEALLAKGNLESHGIEVKYDSASSLPSRYSNSKNEFGLYLNERDFEKAKQILNLTS